MTDKYIKYMDSTGNEIATFIEWVSLDYGRAKNDVGVLDLLIPARLVPGLPIIDGRMEVYRQVGAGGYYLDGDTQWLIRKFDFSGDENDPLLTIQAYDLIHMLSRREIEYEAAITYTDKTNQLDDMMKEIVDENAGAAALVAARDMSPYLQIQPDFTLAPSATKAFSWRKMLLLLQELAQISLENGTWLSFDVVKISDAVAEFQTFVNQRGTDLTDSVVVSQSNGSLTNAKLIFDYSNEITEVTAAGRGEGIDRVTYSAVDAVRVARSPINRIESYMNAAQTSISLSLQGDAEEALKQGRPKIILEGQLIDTKNLQFGVHYNYGDIVTAEHFGYSIPCHIDAYNIKDGGGLEVPTIILRGEIYA